MKKIFYFFLIFIACNSNSTVKDKKYSLINDSLSKVRISDSLASVLKTKKIVDSLATVRIQDSLTKDSIKQVGLKYNSNKKDIVDITNIEKKYDINFNPYYNFEVTNNSNITIDAITIMVERKFMGAHLDYNNYVIKKYISPHTSAMVTNFYLKEYTEMVNGVYTLVHEDGDVTISFFRAHFVDGTIGN